MKRKILLNMIKVILFLLFLSTCWMIYSTTQNMREGLGPAKCSALGDCKSCTGTTTGEGQCTWDSKIGKCRLPNEKDKDNLNWVSTSTQCSGRTTNLTPGTLVTPADALWTDPDFGCPVCPTLYEAPGGSKMTTQASN